MKSYLLLAAGLALICAADATTSYATASGYNSTSGGGGRGEIEKEHPSVVCIPVSIREYTGGDYIDCTAFRTRGLRTWGNAPVVKARAYTAPMLAGSLGVRRNREYRSKSATDEANQR